MNSIRYDNLTLKYQRFTSSDWKDIGIRNFLGVAKTKLLYQETKLFDIVYYLCICVLQVTFSCKYRFWIAHQSAKKSKTLPKVLDQMMKTINFVFSS